jgi:prophage tail gpP-like protein
MKSNLTKLRAVVFPRIKVQRGETRMAVIQRAAEKCGLMVWQAADGSGVIARPNYTQPTNYRIGLHPSTSPRSLESNVISWEHQLTGRETFATYRLSGTSANTANAYGAASHHDLDESDTAVTLARHLIVASTGANKAQAKAQLERDVQRRRFEAVALRYVVAGHQQNGLLWQVDSMVAVDDTINNIVGDYYLTKRRFECSKDRGQTTELTLHPAKELLP